MQWSLRLDRSKASNQLEKRTVCLAVAQLHREGSSIDPFVLQIYNCEVHQEKEPTPEAEKITEKEKKKKITTKFYELLRAGNSWKKIIQLCAKTAIKDTQRKASALSYSGVIWSLGNGSAWERATEEEQVEALSKLGKDFLTHCEIYSPSVDKVLMSLKNQGIGFRPYALPSKRNNDSRDIAPGKRQRRIDQPGRYDPIPNTQSLGSVANRLGSEGNSHDVTDISPSHYSYAHLVLDQLDPSCWGAFGIENT
ncbi:hypothetical protein K505DRAFT_112879 [Melanomma pulvis-pyrius CBS 109.77]|uniref:Uncharacterized protein n=1 Tax=Melanomma pulvis-pyrius CBS 109.77 TaxID=1314802 RepID=A0A6A6WWF1_9PLEO|nr:hypothetical protein K505DRAFT_112879 [Melanomma pulvis-pyrius CBS 109.77]